MRLLSFFISILCLICAPASAGLLTIHDGAGNIGSLNTNTGVATVTASTIVFTDIAYAPDGLLYAIDFSNLYTVDPLTGATALVGSHGVPFANSLVFGPDGVLYAHGGGVKQLFRVNTSTGAGTAIGPTGYLSAGDLAFVDGALYMSTTGGDLVTLNTSTGASALVGSIGFNNVFGLATDPATNTLFGLTGLTLLAINTITGAGSPALRFDGQGFGAIFGTSFFGESVVETPVPGALLLMATALAAFGANRQRKRL